MSLAVDEHRPTVNKLERIQAALEPRYANNTIWHYKGGNCQTLEEELVMEHPEHDDVKDTLAAVVDIAKAPRKRKSNRGDNIVPINSRFGGVAFA
jgi:hypothetical protein